MSTALTSHGRALPVWAYALGLLWIVIALGASGALVYQHLSGHALPGCRAGAGGSGGGGGGSMIAPAAAAPAPVSACASLEAHPLGSLGGMLQWWQARQRGERLDKITPEQAWWPVSFLGATYFAAALAAWLVIGLRKRRVGVIVPWVARLGLLVSLVYLAVIVIAQKYCQYCIATHAANLLLLATLEVGMIVSSRAPSRSSHARPAAARRDLGLPAVAAAMGVFLAATAALGMMQSQKADADAKLSQAQSDDAAKALKAKADADRAAAATQAAAAPTKLPWGDRGFTGRWIYGTRVAAVRVVGFSSYQCPYCRIIEQELFALAAKHPGKVSISHMHFPMSSLCNKHANTNMHPNACWAARAAEAGATIAGSKAALEGKDTTAAANDAFWKLHQWLFGQGGSFTTEQLTAALPGLGFADTAQFMTVMTSPATDKGIHSDIESAIALGLQETPMLYVNGVELRGWQQPGAITRTIESLLASDPPAVGPEADRPILAKEKYIEDWRQEKLIDIPVLADRTIGPADAKVKLVVFGDYTEPNTGKVHQRIRDSIKGKSISYSFRHFPGAMACNPALASLKKDLFVNGCLAARSAEAAGLAGGPDAFWKMSDWLFENAAGVSPERVRAGALSLGLDAAKFDAAFAANGLADVGVQNQVMYAQSISVDRMPKIYVNGRWVRQWISDDQQDVVLDRIIADQLGTK